MDGRRRGLTLVELLVVIGIIAILAGILFPVFSRARAQARQRVCGSNLRQVYLGIRGYCQDWGGMGSRFNPDGGIPMFKYHWFSRFAWLHQDYCPDKRIWMCPEPRPPMAMRDVVADLCPWAFLFLDPQGGEWRTNYDILAGSSFGEDMEWQVIPFPEATSALVMDYPCRWVIWPHERAPHAAGWNVLYFDGHVGADRHPMWNWPHEQY